MYSSSAPNLESGLRGGAAEPEQVLGQSTAPQDPLAQQAALEEEKLPESSVAKDEHPVNVLYCGKQKLKPIALKALEENSKDLRWDDVLLDGQLRVRQIFSTYCMNMTVEQNASRFIYELKVAPFLPEVLSKKKTIEQATIDFFQHGLPSPTSEQIEICQGKNHRFYLVKDRVDCFENDFTSKCQLSTRIVSQPQARFLLTDVPQTQRVNLVLIDLGNDLAKKVATDLLLREVLKTATSLGLPYEATKSATHYQETQFRSWRPNQAAYSQYAAMLDENYSKVKSKPQQFLHQAESLKLPPPVVAPGEAKAFENPHSVGSQEYWFYELCKRKGKKFLEKYGNGLKPRSSVFISKEEAQRRERLKAQQPRPKKGQASGSNPPKTASPMRGQASPMRGQRTPAAASLSSYSMSQPQLEGRNSPISNTPPSLGQMGASEPPSSSVMGSISQQQTPHSSLMRPQMIPGSDSDFSSIPISQSVHSQAQSLQPGLFTQLVPQPQNTPPSLTSMSQPMQDLEMASQPVVSAAPNQRDLMPPSFKAEMQPSSSRQRSKTKSNQPLEDIIIQNNRFKYSRIADFLKDIHTQVFQNEQELEQFVVGEVNKIALASDDLMGDILKREFMQKRILSNTWSSGKTIDDLEIKPPDFGVKETSHYFVLFCKHHKQGGVCDFQVWFTGIGEEGSRTHISHKKNINSYHGITSHVVFK